MSFGASSVLKHALQVGVGVVGGALGAAWLSPHEKVSLAAPPNQVTMNASAIAAEVEARLNQRYALASSQAVVARQTAAEATSALPAPDEPPELSREQSKQLLLREFARDLNAHAADARDPNWARPAESSISEGLMAAHDRNFEVVSVDCKTSTCVATLRWKTRKDAEAGSARAAETVLQPNCESKILLHDVGARENVDSPFEEKLFLNCVAARAE